MPGFLGGYRIDFQIAPYIDIGIVYVFAIGSLAVYGVILAGWASNNKYSFIGGLRSSAQLISYEIPLGLSILGMVLIAGSLDLNDIINWQDRHVWGIFVAPVGFLIFLVSSFAETNRLPFDLPGVGAGADRRLPHRVFGDEVRDVLPGRIPARDHGQLPRGHPVPGRLGHPVSCSTRNRPG